MSHGRVIAEQGHPAISVALGKQIGEKQQSPRLEAVISLTHSPYTLTLHTHLTVGVQALQANDKQLGPTEIANVK